MSDDSIEQIELSDPEPPTQHKNPFNPNAKSNSNMWMVEDGVAFFGCPGTSERVPAGQYTVKMRQGNPYLALSSVNVDSLIELPDSASEEIIENIEAFWRNEEAFREYGFLWKRGILLMGPPGGGKTSTVQTISKKIQEKDGISVYVKNPDLAIEGLQLLRKIEPTRNVVVILEDIDAMIDEYDESVVLAILDGELQIDNVVFVATTNYPEKLDKRIINRPSRFDVLKRIDMPTAEARRAYLEHKEIDEELIREWVEKTDGFSIAHLKEMIVSIIIMGNDTDETIKRLRKMMTDRPSSDDDCGGSNTGFI